MKSDKNYFVCNRSLFKKPLWNSEPFTKGQAWVDLFGKANHSDGGFEVKGQWVDIKRGQTGRSIQTLAEDWKWSRNKVKRFLKRLEDERMIERVRDHNVDHLTSIITICNYDKFQLGEKTDELPDEPPNGPSNEPSDGPQTIKKEGIIKKKEYSEDSNEFRLSLYLLNHIKKHSPGFKDPNLQKWSIDSDRLLRIDKRNLEECKKLIRFAHASDDLFFRNVLSPAKFRKRYDEIKVGLDRHSCGRNGEAPSIESALEKYGDFLNGNSGNDQGCIELTNQDFSSETFGGNGNYLDDGSK